MDSDHDAVYRAAAVRAVTRALAAHGGTTAASVDEGVNPDNGVWSVDVTPHREGAAKVYVAHFSDEFILGFGETHVYMWEDNPEALADEIEQVLAGVLAGQVVEVGPLGDSTATLVDGRGETRRVGAMSLIPWRFRRARRTYEPYS